MKAKIVKGTLIGTIKITAKPMGFFTPEGMLTKNRNEDIGIFEESLNCALDKDKVEIEIIGKDRDRKKGKVIKILERNKTNFVGTLEKSGNSFTFVPDDWKFYKKVDISVVPKDAKPGLKALVAIEWQNPSLNPKGKVLQVIGEKGVHETEMQSILLDKGIVYNFPADVEEEAQEVAKGVSKGHPLGQDSSRVTLGEKTPFDIFDTCSIPPKARAEDLTVDNWICLTKNLL